MSAPCEPWRQDVEGLRLTHWGSTGPTILLIHGYGYDARVWGGFAPHLAADTHVIAVEWDSQGAPLRWGDIFAQVRKVTSAVSSVDLVVAHAEGAAAAVNLALEGFCPALLLFGPVPDIWPPEARIDYRNLPRELPPSDNPLEDEIFAAIGEVAEHPERGVDRIIQVATELFTPDVQYEEDAALIRPIVDRQFRTIEEQPVLEFSEPSWVDQLRDVSVPVLVATTGVEEVFAALAPRGEVVHLDTRLPMPWLEDRSQAIEIVKRLLP